jgi:hypothetical protein
MQGFRISAVFAVIAISAITGCKTSHERATDAAIAEARHQAAQSGVAQQVSWSDVSGNVYKVLIQPPLPGQATEAITRTVSKQPGDPRVLAPLTNAPWGPVITPVPASSKSSPAASK